MSASKHTPGPWSHHVDIACKCGGIGSKDHPIAKVYSGDWGDDFATIQIEGGSLDRRAVAVMEQITYGHIDPAEADANARLIAAAPDQHAVLLAAPIISIFCKKDGFDETGFFAAYEEWSKLKRAAIAKATGDAS